MGEGGGFPGSGKAVAEWFPPKERGLAFGIFNAGSSLGAVLAPPLIALIVSLLGWRWVFFITGGIGFLWAWIWLKIYEVPARCRYITDEERDLLQQHSIETKRPEDAPVREVSWLSLFTFREVQGLMAAKFLTDAAWYCFIFWLPRYLQDVRHLDIKQVGYFAWIPYAAAGVGSLSGGFLGGELLRRGYSLNAARKISLAIGAALMPASTLIVSSPLSLAIVLFSTAMFAHQFWSSNVQTVPADLFPPRYVGSVEGLLGSAGSFGGMLFGLFVGSIVSSQGYGPVFLISGLLHPLAFLVILGTVRRVEPVQFRS
jgi:MFS transporter, ACS family, hexuronate transporter